MVKWVAAGWWGWPGVPLGPGARLNVIRHELCLINWYGCFQVCRFMPRSGSFTSGMTDAWQTVSRTYSIMKGDCCRESLLVFLIWRMREGVREALVTCSKRTGEYWPRAHTVGRHCEYIAAQLYRVHWLCLLSPVHSVNLLIKLLPEQRAWRKFAGLRRQSRVPDVRMMHQLAALDNVRRQDRSGESPGKHQ